MILAWAVERWDSYVTWGAGQGMGRGRGWRFERLMDKENIQEAELL